MKILLNVLLQRQLRERLSITSSRFFEVFAEVLTPLTLRKERQDNEMNIKLSKPNPNSNSMQLGLRLDTVHTANPPPPTTFFEKSLNEK